MATLVLSTVAIILLSQTLVEKPLHSWSRSLNSATQDDPKKAGLHVSL